jgi:hypothetical protein
LAPVNPVPPSCSSPIASKRRSTNRSLNQSPSFTRATTSGSCRHPTPHRRHLISSRIACDRRAVSTRGYARSVKNLYFSESPENCRSNMRNPPTRA